MTNAEKIMEKGWMFGSDMVVRMWGNSKTDSCFASWLDEEYVEPPVLDKAERKYLRAVIAPFESKVLWIRKEEDPDFKDVACLHGKLAHHIDGDFDLPNFDVDEMYKGMELGKEYTLEELRLV